ncbi:GspE/PulE family protein [Fangia hongkongensis]|uniref:GspE/PulE family protein n=1 Tax=Fangia hongkongensis TaxID=270495 RepID=UPI0003797130|nr:ATPase, T2SS/T4P/T4SS family [Fangia hongkongensis]MBK2125905.1 Flp pilus assembly complex ATPase component TadA [Fangia hongkongensis]
MQSPSTYSHPKMHLDMLKWCRSQKGAPIAVIENGDVLVTKKTAPNLQNCKVLMKNKGIKINQIHIRSASEIDALLAQMDPHFIQSLSKVQLQLRNCIEKAISQNVSDVHIEVRLTQCEVKFRQLGELVLYDTWSTELARKICFVAFNKETDHTQQHFNGHIPQDASMSLQLTSGIRVRIRLASVPAHPFPSFDVVLRILNTDAQKQLNLSQCGYSSQQTQLLQTAIKKPSGAIIIAGPTGSGKTTTLAALLSTLPKHKKLYVIEDPVEKIISNATQIPVNTEVDSKGFASMTRQTLRLDPDCICIGEIRDHETALMASRAAMTGHLVLSTVHSNSAINIIQRLLDLELTPSQLADESFLVLLAFQMLIKVLCPHCAVPINDCKLNQEDIERWERYFLTDDINFFDQVNMHRSYAKGTTHHCTHCNNSGYLGRRVIAEIIWLDDISREYILKHDYLGWKAHLQRAHFHSHIDQARLLIKHGQVDLYDAEMILGQFSPFEKEIQGINYNNIIKSSYDTEQTSTATD